MIKKILKWALYILLALLAVLAVMVALNWSTVQRVFLGGVKVYETTPPQLPADLKRPAILVFSKTNGFRHEEAIPAANKLFADYAAQQGWGIFQTENGATFAPDILAKFDAIVFNNVSGDVFTPAQREALKNYVENGGGFVGIHGAGGDFSYDWKFYVNDLVGAQFSGHPLGPQFQKARLVVEDKSHPATTSLPDSWSRTDEWYSFEKSPRREGYHILATLDETTYSPIMNMGFSKKQLAMGKDHPVVWWHCQGKGRAFYSALGHQAAAYAEPEYAAMLHGALGWAASKAGNSCETNPAAATEKK